MKTSGWLLLYCIVILLILFVGVNRETGSKMATNYAPIPDAWEWNHGGFPQFTFVDYAVTHNGHPSLRLEADYVGERESVSYPEGRNGNWQWGFPVTPGDHVVFKVWIKTASAENPSNNDDNNYGGARCGVFFYGGGKAVYNYPQTIMDNSWYVPYGHGWQQVVYDFIVPATYFDHDVSWAPGEPWPPDKPISPRQIDWFACWLQGMPWTEKGAVWFADAELYINPTEPPPPIPPPPAEYYTVIVRAGAGGQVTPAGPNQVLVGINFSMHATANMDYTFSYWTRNDTQVSTNPNYTITDGTTNSIYEMVAYFTYNPPPTSTFTVIISSSTGGSTVPSGTQTSNVGTPISITATADGGYTFSHWLRDGNIYSTSNPVSILGYANQTIMVQAAFEANPPPPPPIPPSPTTYIVNIETATGGSTNYTGTQTVNVGDSLTVQAEPNDNYMFSYWLLDNVDAGANLSITITGTAGSTYNLRPVFQYVSPPPPPEPLPIPPPIIGSLGGTLLPMLIGKFEKQKPINFDDLINALKKANL